MFNLRRAIALAGACWVLGIATAPTAAAEPITLPDMDSLTGIAWDSDGEQLLAVSDTDTTGTISLFDEAGVATGTITFGAEPESVQAIAVHEGQAYIADIGDETGSRDMVTIYQVEIADGKQSYRAWDFQYPDGAQDAKAFLVSGKGRFYIITDGNDPKIYRSTLEPSRSELNTWTESTDAPSGVTDATFIQPDGDVMVIRTGDGVETLDAYTWESVGTRTYVDGPEDESLTTVSETDILVGSAAGLRDETVPEGETTTTPTAVASPSESSSETASESPTATAEETQEEESDGGTVPVERRGTLIAIGGALLLSLAAGIFVFVKRS